MLVPSKENKSVFWRIKGEMNGLLLISLHVRAIGTCLSNRTTLILDILKSIVWDASFLFTQEYVVRCVHELAGMEASARVIAQAGTERRRTTGGCFDKWCVCV
jgi:hypothetical protein